MGAVWSECRSLLRFASFALYRAELSEASTTEESMPIIAMTTMSSMSVKPRVFFIVSIRQRTGTG